MTQWLYRKTIESSGASSVSERGFGARPTARRGRGFSVETGAELRPSAQRRGLLSLKIETNKPIAPKVDRSPKRIPPVLAPRRHWLRQRVCCIGTVILKTSHANGDRLFARSPAELPVGYASSFGSRLPHGVASDRTSPLRSESSLSKHSLFW